MRHAQAMFGRSQVDLPRDLRARLEAARLDLLALFRALDRMHLTPEQIPQRLLQQLFELDADYAEALWRLDQPPGKLNRRALLRDTLAALERLPAACSAFGKPFHPTRNPLCPKSNSQSVSTSTRRRPTTWSQVATPRTVKHPCRSDEPRFAGFWADLFLGEIG
jgi:hypothetical protein